MLKANSSNYRPTPPCHHRQQIFKVVLASVLCFTSAGLYADTTDATAISPQNANEATLPNTSTNAANTAQSEALATERRRADSIDRITRFMDMGTTANIETMLERHMKAYPNDPNAYGQLSRIHMKLGAVSDDSLLGYHYSDEADKRALDALNESLTLQENNAEELSRLGHLHAVQGRYDDAARAFEKVRQLNKTPAWLNFNEAIMHTGRGEFVQAAASLQPMTSKRPSDNSNVAWNIYRSSWRLRTTLALAHPETDPVPAVASGKMVRLPMHSLYEEALRRSSGDKPTIVFVSSGDSGCGPCATDMATLSEVSDALSDNYQLLYTSVEPWNDIKKHTVVQRAFNLKGVPNHILMHKGQMLTTVNSYLAPNKIDTYKQYQAKILDGEFDLKKVRSYDELLREDIRYKIRAALENKDNFSAAAVAIDGRAWTSGIVEGHNSQAEANDAAMARCERNRQSRDVTTACSVYSTPQ